MSARTGSSVQQPLLWPHDAQPGPGAAAGELFLLGLLLRGFLPG